MCFFPLSVDSSFHSSCTKTNESWRNVQAKGKQSKRKKLHSITGIQLEIEFSNEHRCVGVASPLNQHHISFSLIPSQTLNTRSCKSWSVVCTLRSPIVVSVWTAGNWYFESCTYANIVAKNSGERRSQCAQYFFFCTLNSVCFVQEQENSITRRDGFDLSLSEQTVGMCQRKKLNFHSYHLNTIRSVVSYFFSYIFTLN